MTFISCILWNIAKNFNLGINNLLMLPDWQLKLLIENVEVLVSASKFILIRTEQKSSNYWSLTWKKLLQLFASNEQLFKLGLVIAVNANSVILQEGYISENHCCLFCGFMLNILSLWNYVLQTKIITSESHWNYSK